MRAVLTVMLLVVLVALVGCGAGSGTTGRIDAAPLTKAQWVRRADADCHRAAEAIAPLRDDFGRLIGRDDLEMAAEKERLIVFQLERNGERLRHLGAPAEGAGATRRLEGRLERTVEQNIDLAEALEADEAPAAARLQVQIHRTQLSGLVLAHEIGLEVCGTE